MNTLKLNFKGYNGIVGTAGWGTLITVNPGNDTNIFNRLVGQCGYQILFQKDSDHTQQITWNVNIFSDGSDNDAGNGNLTANATKV